MSQTVLILVGSSGGSAGGKGKDGIRAMHRVKYLS